MDDSKIAVRLSISWMCLQKQKSQGEVDYTGAGMMPPSDRVPPG